MKAATTEYFSRRTDPAFDPLGAATIAADLALGALLDPNRAARMIDFHAQNAANPDFKEALDAIIAATWKTPAPQNAYHQRDPTFRAEPDCATFDGSGRQ